MTNTVNTAAASGAADNCTILPDGSAFAVGSFPLPQDHWLYAPHEYEPGSYEPKELLAPILTHAQRNEVVAAVRYAVRGATMCGKEPDFDPDALVQNAVYALCGSFGRTALATTAQAAPQPSPAAQAGESVPAVDESYKQALWSKNCMQCCVSYMLGFPLESVPDFATDGGWELFSEFVESKGYAAVMLPGNSEFEADYLASGTTERGTSHMVVMNDGKLAHDPHPSNAGLVDVQCVWLLAKRATPRTVQADEHAEFETAAKAYTSNVNFERDGTGYADMTAELLWHGWKLRASHGQAPAQAVPAAVAGPSGYGPNVTVRRSCSDCKACNSESYAVQGDSGHYVYCEHPSLPESKYIGDTNWNTPHWCPVSAPTTQPAPQPSPAAQGDALDADPLQGAANWLAQAHGMFSPTVLQGCLMIGYNRAKRLHDAALAAQEGKSHGSA